MKTDLRCLEEIYFLQDEEYFFVGLPLATRGEWQSYMTFDDVGESPSIYLFHTTMVSEKVTHSPYLDLIRFAIQRQSLPQNIDTTMVSTHKNIDNLLSVHQVVGIGIDDERVLGKISALTPNGVSLTEFDFTTCRLVEENLEFTFSEIAHIELASQRTKLITDYLNLS